MKLTFESEYGFFVEFQVVWDLEHFILVNNNVSIFDLHTKMVTTLINKSMLSHSSISNVVTVHFYSKNQNPKRDNLKNFRH
jgi:hypothetical protein